MVQVLELGSSPRVRGAAGDAHRRVVPLGIIPACAGSRTFLLEALGQLGDHPRVCGEQVQGRTLRAFTMGSSPRVRGAAYLGHEQLGQTGIIPACAGSRLTGQRLVSF